MCFLNIMEGVLEPLIGALEIILLMILPVIRKLTLVQETMIIQLSLEFMEIQNITKPLGALGQPFKLDQNKSY